MKWILNYGYKYNEVFSYEYPKSDFKNKIQIIYMGWFWKTGVWQIMGVILF